MKIPSSSGEILDTDNLNDKDAVLFEALNDFYKVCEKYNVTAFGRVILNERKGLGDSFGVLYLPNSSDEIRNKEYIKLIASIADWISKTSNGRFQVFDTLDDSIKENIDDENPSIE